LSKHFLASAWAQREMNSAIMSELSKRSIHIFPIRLDDCEIPVLLTDRKFADFSKSYQEGYKNLLEAIQAKSGELR
jgi:hypothetical protein